MKELFAAIRQWWFARTGRPPPYEAQLVESDPPHTMQPQIIYIVTEDGQPWHASLVCPCGCGAALHLNLLPDDRPCWLLIKHWHGLISLHPSVWRTKGCRSHFWLHRGRIRWCGHPQPPTPETQHRWIA